MDELEPLRAALATFALELAAQGLPPGAVRRMRWRTSDPTRFAIGQRGVELALRDVFGGVLPAVTVERDERVAIAVDGEVEPPGAPPEGAVYHGYTVGQLAREYSPRVLVPDHLAIFARWRSDGAAFRAGQRIVADLAYGPTAGQTLDLVLPPPANVAPPLVLFFHGGYWQAMDKADHAQFAAPFVAAGMAVAVVNYDLAPPATLAEIVLQAERAVRFLAGAAPAHGYAAGGMTVAGHSAGAHLAGLLAATDWPGVDPTLPSDLIGAALLVSGLYDLEPIQLLPMGPLLGLDAAEARRLSPLHRRPLPHVRNLIALGGDESAEFHWQSAALAEVWGRHGAQVRLLDIPGTHHFSVVEALCGGSFTEEALACIAGEAQKWRAI